MGIMLVIAPFFFAVITQIVSITASFYPKYLWVTQIANFVTVLLIAIGIFLVYMLEPVSNFIDAKFGRGKTIWFILGKNGNIAMKVGKAKNGNNDIEGYGTFLDNTYARKIFAGLPAYQIFEDCAVPAETDTIELCTRLENAGIKSLEEWSANPSRIQYKDLDLKSVKRYFNNLAPFFVNVRIERIAAELSAQYRQAWKAILPWISIMLVGLIFAAIAYVIIMSVTQQPVATPPPAGYTPPAYVPDVGN